MKIKIFKSSMVYEIKKEFCSEYDFLKLEFIFTPYLPIGQRLPIIATDNTKLGNIQPAMREGAFVVDGATTVAELEAFFRNHLLDVQVFRQSLNLWLETTMSEGWTLKKQNSLGKEISEFKRNPIAVRGA